MQAPPTCTRLGGCHQHPQHKPCCTNHILSNAVPPAEAELRFSRNYSGCYSVRHFTCAPAPLAEAWLQPYHRPHEQCCALFIMNMMGYTPEGPAHCPLPSQPTDARMGCTRSDQRTRNCNTHVQPAPLIFFLVLLGPLMMKNIYLGISVRTEQQK